MRKTPRMEAVRGCLGIALGLLLSGALGAQGPPAQSPSFRSASSELVVLPVLVTDRQGQFVSDLPGARFAVYDNGRRQSVSFFSNSDAPVTVGLVIDTSGSMAAKLPHVEAATLALARSSNPDDEIFVIAFNDTVRDILPERLVRAADFAQLEASLSGLVPQGQTALYDALVAGLDRLSAATRERKVLVLVSDGADNKSRATLADVLARARAANVAIYTVGLFDAASLDRNPGVLKDLAAATGGERFLPRSPGLMLQACQRIARDIRHTYMLAYVPPDRDGTYHEVRVKIEPPGGERGERGERGEQSGRGGRLTVRTRPGYVAAAAAR
jgi:Ca-activated chloride channel family protein